MATLYIMLHHGPIPNKSHEQIKENEEEVMPPFYPFIASSADSLPSTNRHPNSKTLSAHLKEELSKVKMNF